jgi:hypothetical protein
MNKIYSACRYAGRFGNASLQKKPAFLYVQLNRYRNRYIFDQILACARARIIIILACQNVIYHDFYKFRYDLAERELFDLARSKIIALNFFIFPELENKI